MTDFHDTLHSAQQGDEKALEGLFNQWRPLLRLQAAQLLGAELSARVDPSDVVQEALSQASGELDRFRGQTAGQWVAWLQTLVTGHAAKLQRHHHAQRRGVSQEVALGETQDAAAVDSATSPVKQAIDHEQAAQLAHAIAALPEEMQTLIIRRVFWRQSWEETAAALGKSPGAARVQWTRAIAKLREMLEE